jgi:hypothetical protein
LFLRIVGSSYLILLLYLLFVCSYGLLARRICLCYCTYCLFVPTDCWFVVFVCVTVLTVCSFLRIVGSLHFRMSAEHTTITFCSVLLHISASEA